MLYTDVLNIYSFRESRGQKGKYGIAAVCRGDLSSHARERERDWGDGRGVFFRTLFLETILSMYVSPALSLRAKASLQVWPINFEKIVKTLRQIILET